MNAQPEVPSTEPIREGCFEEVPWSESARFSATAESLDALFCGKLAGLSVPAFLTNEECHELKRRVELVEFGEYENVWPRIGRIGVTVFEYQHTGRAAYFSAVAGANSTAAAITEGICNPVQRVIDWLSRLSPENPVGIAHEDRYGEYFAGLFRRIEAGTMIHVDFAPLEQPGWAVASVHSQLTWNIYIDVPRANPGLVNIWKKQWSPNDHAFKVPGSYGYQTAVVQGIPCAQIVPQMGMLMITNTRNFHQVTPAGGGRLSISSAAGRTSDGQIILWS